MKTHFAIVLVSVAALISVDAKIPDYIHICKRNNPELNKCVRNSINILREKLIEGIPDLDVPSLDPMYLEKLVLNLGNGLSGIGRQLKVTGGGRYEIKNLTVDIAGDTFGFDVWFPEIVTRGNYEIDAAIGAIALRGKGPIFIKTETVSGRGKLFGKQVPRAGKNLYYFHRLDLKLEIGDYNIKLDNLFEGEAALGEVTNRLLNDERTEILPALLPGIEEAASEQLLRIANGIYRHFSYDDLFPAS